MPTEKSLQRSRPHHCDSPACQARLEHGTNCSSAPSRRIKKCDETRRIKPAFDGYKPDGASHFRIRDTQNGLSRRHGIQAKRCADMLFNRGLCCRDIKACKCATNGPRGVDPPKHQIGIGQGRAIIALPVAYRARSAACAFRPHLQQATAIHPRDVVKRALDLPKPEMPELPRQRSLPEGTAAATEMLKVLLKLIVERASRRVLGCHMVGEHAAEIIQMAAIAIGMGATKADFDRTMALHPSVAEEFVTMPN